METQILEDIGLTQGEIKVYLALLEQGTSPAGKILEKANIQNSVFHFCVNRLIEKGLVSYIKKGKTRLYTSADPTQFRTYIKDKEKQIETILPELQARQTFAEEKKGVELFEGIKGIMTLLNLLIENTKAGDEYLFFPADIEEKNEEIQKFYRRYDAKRKEAGLVMKCIAPARLKKLFKDRPFQMKYTEMPIPANQGICNDKMVMISWGEKPQGVLIHSKQIIQKQKEFFNALWDSLS
ncbi:TrmB family transcriptional regulator [Nanoarchaeota archaeon]